MAKKEKVNMLIPKVDVVFQSLFSKNHPKITKAFAETLLEEKIESIKINEDKELIRSNPNDKLGILDLELDINNKEKVDVEIQLINKENFIKRMLYYVTRLYSDQMKRGAEYTEVKRVVLVAIVDFEIEELKEIEEMETKWKLIETKKREKILTELIEINIINLRKALKEYEKDKTNKKAQWMLFLNNPNSKEVKAIMKENKEIEECVITVKEMSEDEKMQRLAFLRKKAIMDEKAIRKKGYNDGMEKGIEKGKKDGKIEIVKKLIKEGKDVEYIKDLTGIEEKEIEELITNNQCSR